MPLSSLSFEEFVDLLKSFLTVTKINESKQEVVARCPVCGDSVKHPHKGHLGISYEKRVFHCFRCGYKGTLKKLISDNIYKIKDLSVLEKAQKFLIVEQFLLNQPIGILQDNNSTIDLYQIKSIIESKLNRIISISYKEHQKVYKSFLSYLLKRVSFEDTKQDFIGIFNEDSQLRRYIKIFVSKIPIKISKVGYEITKHSHLLLDNRIYFMSYFYTKASARKVFDSISIYNSRYITYTFYDGYPVADFFILLYKNPFNIFIVEGPIDAIKVYLTFRSDGIENFAVISLFGKNYKKLFEFLATIYGEDYKNYTYYLMLDFDVPSQEYRRIINYILTKIANDKLFIFEWKSDKYKDVGEIKTKDEFYNILNPITAAAFLAKLNFSF